MGIKKGLRRIIRSSSALYSVVLVYRNTKSRIRYSRGQIDTSSGTIHSSFSIESSLDYIQEVFDDYKRYGNIKKFYGEVAEIGPGDSCGVGIKFLQDGCQSVDLADKYYSHREDGREKNIIASLCRNGDSIFVNPDLKEKHSEENIKGLKRFYGQEAASENFFRSGKKYSFIVSRAVLEHVDDPIESLKEMVEALAPDGRLLHKVDLSDHNLFSPENSELTFLRFPNWYYRLMCLGSGRPNRFMANQYEKVMNESGLQYSILVTSLVGVGEISPHAEWNDIDQDKKEQSLRIVREQMAGLSSEFNSLDEKYIAISGIFIVARKEK